MTTTIARPRARRASDEGRSRLGDIRRRVPRGDRITPQRRSAWLFGLAAVVVAGAIGAALFGLPVRTWFEQDDQLAGLEFELSELQGVNSDLQNEVERLQTGDGIREAAREELGHIEAGDHRETVLALPPLPRDLPDGWPYSQVDNILTIRAQAAAAAAASAVAPGTDASAGQGGWFEPPTTTPTAAIAPVAPAPAVVAPPTPTPTASLPVTTSATAREATT